MAAKRWAGGYTADRMAAAVALSAFPRCLVAVDRCTWAGEEADLLVITKSLRVVDVEVKVSRSDLRADRHKSKWRTDSMWPRRWPQTVWKHYYAVPETLWCDALVDDTNPRSGVLLVSQLERNGNPAHARVRVYRKAKANIKAPRLAPEDLWAVARLANLRMWDSYAKLARVQA